MPTPTRSPLSDRLPTLLADGLAIAVGVATLLYTAGFTGNWLLPKTVDSAAAPVLPAPLLVDLLLLAAFALPHSLLARDAVRRRLTGRFGPAGRRLVQAVTTALSMGLLIALWQPMGGLVWEIGEPFARGVLNGLFVAGWLALVWRALRPGRTAPHPPLPAWIAALWASPTLSAGHLLFALVLTAYAVIAARHVGPRPEISFIDETERDTAAPALPLPPTRHRAYADLT